MWRGSTTVSDRIFAALPYLLPLLSGLVFGRFLLQSLPILGLLLSPLFPILTLLALVPFSSFLVFLGLYFWVVRNYKIHHFIRFNTMQAILIDIALAIFSILWQFALGPILGTTIVTEVILNMLFLGTLGVTVYSVIQCALGRYAEMPVVSEAAYYYVRY